MCVIIYVPKESTIDDDELLDAWTTNPDGAGFAIQENGKVHFERGFMTFTEFYSAINQYIGEKNLLLHFRISTSKAINKVQTHPYKKGNVTLLKGDTDKPIICMNGVISGQKEYEGCNDTMSYIIDHQQAFSTVNQDVLNIIESDTGAKWAVMTPDEVLLSSKFVEKDGKFYSNRNHKLTYNSFYYYPKKKVRRKLSMKDIIQTKKLRQSLMKDVRLYTDVLDYIDFNCSYGDVCDCTKCLKSCHTLRDIKTVLNENYYYNPYEEWESVDETEDACKLTNNLYDEYILE